jgi:hypothetical protein
LDLLLSGVVGGVCGNLTLIHDFPERFGAFFRSASATRAGPRTTFTGETNQTYSRKAIVQLIEDSGIEKLVYGLEAFGDQVVDSGRAVVHITLTVALDKEVRVLFYH